jgi:hypothetical protein
MLFVVYEVYLFAVLYGQKSNPYIPNGIISPGREGAIIISGSQGGCYYYQRQHIVMVCIINEIISCVCKAADSPINRSL